VVAVCQSQPGGASCRSSHVRNAPLATLGHRSATCRDGPGPDIRQFAVGTRVTSRPPPRSVRAAFPHTAPTSGQTATACRMQASACDTLTRLRVRRVPCQPHSPWSPPLAPPTPQQIAPLCSPASQLLWQGQTSRVRASSATAPHLPDAGRHGNAAPVKPETSQLPMRSLRT
jgi:hypothetical protein